MTDSIQCQIKKGIATVTLNRPESYNALDVAMLEHLPELLSALAADEAVRCVLVTGTGEKAFCAGGDISSLAEGEATPESYEPLIAKLNSWAQASVLLHTMPKPTVAVINGVAAGAGLALALACDLRIASHKASLVTAFAKVAMPGDFGGSYFLSRLVGSAKAKELYWLSPKLSADEAQQLGLISRLSDSASLMADAQVLAAQLTALPAATTAAMKANINSAVDIGLSATIAQEAEAMIRAAFSPEVQGAAQRVLKDNGKKDK